MIELMHVTIYLRGPGPYRGVDFITPNWTIVDEQLKTMDSFEKPMLTLLQNANHPDANVMTVCGGGDLFHISIADSKGFWSQVVDPDGSDENIAVWTSDQGFDPEKKYTWPLDHTRKLVRYYYEHETQHPDYNWE